MLDRIKAYPVGVEDDFRAAMRQLASGVSVVTAGTREDRSGFTATSVVSLSVDPPRLLVSVNSGSSTWPLIARHGGFTVNLLAADQVHIAEVFAGRSGLRGKERFTEGRWQRHPVAGYGLEGALAVVHCRVEETIERHGHKLVIGCVLDSVAAPAQPLLYWNRSYPILPEQG